MLALIQFPWSPFCITIRHILERHNIPHRIQNIPLHDRSAVIRATRGRAYTVPCVLDGRRAICDLTDFGQEVARYVDARFRLRLFPRAKEGIQAILARYIENDLEGVGFKVNDGYVIRKLPLVERVMVTRHKERKFGKGCVEQWAKDCSRLQKQFTELLRPIDNILASSRFLTGDSAVFVDYDLYGILGNYLYHGRTPFPSLKNLRRFHDELGR